MRAVLLLATALALAPRTLSAQFLGLGGSVSESDLLYLAGQPRLALEVLEEHLASDSTDYGALWRAARAAAVAGLAEEGNRQQNRWFDPAISYGQRAVAVRPDGIDGLYWRGVSAGQRARNAGPRYAVDLAQIVYDDAHSILAIDSLYAGAYNMLGRLNHEVMSLSRIQRAIARLFMGNDALSDTSWENAEYYLRRAVELGPDNVRFQFDLARFYLKRGPREEAVRSFQRTIDLPAVRPTDSSVQTEARALLDDLGS